MPYTSVLFDLDGTIIDSIGLIVDSFHHTFAFFGLDRRPDVEWVHSIGVPLRAVLAPWAADEAGLDAMIAVYRAHNVENHDARVSVYPGMTRAVRALSAAGVRLALVTSKSRSGADRGLRIAGLEGVMDAIVCAEDVVNAKPHREPVDKAIELLRGDPRTTLFVGDSVHDMESGRAAGVSTGAAMWGPFARRDLEASAPSHWIASPEDVIRIALDAIAT